jgi:hypothetical protein
MERKSKKVKVIRILRAASQILFFFLLPGFYVSALSSLRQIYTSAVTGSFSLSAMLPQLAIIIAVFPITILLGRFFCSWMCAFGSLGDLISLISHKLFKRRLRIPPKVDKALRYVKYLVLVFLVIAVWTLGFSGFKSFNPWDVFGIIPHARQRSGFFLRLFCSSSRHGDTRRDNYRFVFRRPLLLPLSLPARSSIRAYLPSQDNEYQKADRRLREMPCLYKCLPYGHRTLQDG